ncbi:hypothetical protein LTS02_009193 [Friedmanniomyces endolithicus]|nr:hypothetical protein LTS02_009193 [Friedmanniomyces endolithicus]
MAEMQTIPARHGVATFVPAGQTIKIVNTSGTQVVDTWAFALPKPEEKKGGAPDEKQEDEAKGKKEGKADEKKGEQKAEEKSEQKTEEKAAPKATPKKKKDGDFPSQEEAEKATSNPVQEGEGKAKDGKDSKDAKDATPQKSTWSSYVPSLPTLRSSKPASAPKKGAETEQQKNSRTWGSYFPSGQGFTSYIPSTASNTVSQFAKGHEVDKNMSYMEQLQSFSKTPVGAAGLAALTGSGYGGSLYAGYNAYNSQNAPDEPPMEYMSMAHSRAGTLHMRPQVNDTLVSNLREPMLTLIEDTSPGIHDTLMVACDPYRYHGLGVKDWAAHGSCAENLVLALKELNERAGLKGAKGVGADVTINAVPAPLNLFMNIPWDDSGDLAFKSPKGKEGDYVRLKAERDMVVVMSACPQDVLDINAKKPTDAHFVVEAEGESAGDALKRSQQPPPAKKRPAPRKLGSSRAPSTAGTEGGGDAKAGAPAAAPAKKPEAPKKAAAPKKQPEADAAPEKKPASGEKADAPVPAKKPAAKPAAAKPAAKPAPAKKEAAPAKKEETGGDAAPVEKKKPKKLAARPKVEEKKAES